VRRVSLIAVMMAFAARAFCAAPGLSEQEHVPPDPPQSRVHEMPYREMAEMMGMNDRKRFGKVMLDRAEWRDGDSSTYEWDAAAWYGGDFNKLWVEFEGESVDGSSIGRTELLWDRIVSPWWSTRLGWRGDFGHGSSKNWLAFGVAGMAPGFIELSAMAYISDDGHAAFRLSTEYDCLLTQRWVLQPQFELNAYSHADPVRRIGSGVSDIELGLRLRYEIRREFAPYLGVSWAKRFGESADLASAAGENPDEVSLVAGIRAWF